LLGVNVVWQKRITGPRDDYKALWATKCLVDLLLAELTVLRSDFTTLLLRWVSRLRCFNMGKRIVWSRVTLSHWNKYHVVNRRRSCLLLFTSRSSQRLCCWGKLLFGVYRYIGSGSLTGDNVSRRIENEQHTFPPSCHFEQRRFLGLIDMSISYMGI
jgi:hypothetical protein